MMPAVWSLCQVALVHLRNSPAFEDVIPSKMFEAMGMGLPIILALPSGEARGILEADGAGIYVPPENATALAAAVTRLADKPKLYQSLRAQSMAAAPGHSRETQAEHMICALKAVIEGKGIRVAEIPIPGVH
jgi:glycosyltransferase involved in cell wall biosynthesis